MILKNLMQITMNSQKERTGESRGASFTEESTEIMLL
jgi:hypothetical protein